MGLFSLSFCDVGIGAHMLLQRLVILGSFGVRVIRGEVVVLGATLGPSKEVQWLHAPQCHALPVLRSSARSCLEVHNDVEAISLRKLGNLSPLFRAIWNEDEAQQSSRPMPTFRIVSRSVSTALATLTDPLPALFS